MHNTNKRRVAITGIGIVSPLGNSRDSSWQALLSRQSGIAEIKSFDASEFPTRIAAEVKQFSAAASIDDPKLLRAASPFTQFALVAAEEAMQDAQIAPQAKDAHRWGLVVGSGMMTADWDYWQRFSAQFVKNAELDESTMPEQFKKFYSTLDFSHTESNSGLGLLAKRHQIQGYATSVHTACASGGQALGLALQAMRRNEVDQVLVGGFDSMINPYGLSSFCLLGALSTYNDTPETASRPFDLQRNGFVLGEGAAFMILEDLAAATKRGAKIYAELAGEGNSLSSYRITDSPPDGEGARQAILGALADADEPIERVDYINAHGTSTQMNDLSETNAIKAALQSRALQVACSSTKSQTGHLIAAAGAIEGAFTALAIYHGCVPMTANLTTPDPSCDLDYVVGGPRKQKIRVALSNSFGFGGSNSCIVFRDPQAYEESL